MANYNNLKTGIDAVIKTNGRQDISGAALNTALNNMITELGAGYQYMGLATPATNPDTPDANVFYLASESGTYTNFGGIVINEGEVCALVWNGTWTKQVTGAATADQLNQLGQKVTPIANEFDTLPYYAVFNGVSSIATCTEIVLENEGDSLEIELFPGASTNSTNQYAIAQQSSEYNPRLGSSRTVVSVRADDNTWIAVGETFGSTKDHYVLKVAFEESKTNVYVDDTLIKTYNGQKKITINRWGNYTSYYWEGKIGFIKINGTLYSSITYIPGWTGTNISNTTIDGFLNQSQSEKLNNAEQTANKVQSISDSSTVTEYPSAKAVHDYAGQAVELAPMIDAGKNELKKLVPVAIFHNSTAETDLIRLQNEGDYIEMELWPGEMSGNQKYALVNRAYDAVGLGATRWDISVRADDNTWIALAQSLGSEKTHYILKVAFEDGDIKIYIDGTIFYTYTGQKTISLQYWGQYSTTNFWDGKIGYVIVNGIYYANPSQLPGWSSATVTMSSIGTIVNKADAEALNLVKKDIRIVPESNKVGVYFRVSGYVYGYLEVNHVVNTDDYGGTNPYSDLWRIANIGSLYNRTDNDFMQIANTHLLIGAENEFAIRFTQFGDFTGGYHGNEKIVAANGDYILFFVNGKAYTLAELLTAGAQDCDTFGYRQVSTMFADYAYNPDHLKIAKHFKDTEFTNRGFKTKNYLIMDLSELSANSLSISDAFLGLVCVHKDCASVVTGDDGQEYTATHPNDTTLLAGDIDKYSRKVSYRNGNFSCDVDTDLLGTNIESWKNAPTKVYIYDRANDTKYYSYMPATHYNQTVVDTGDFYAGECRVSWNYKN